MLLLKADIPEDSYLDYGFENISFSLHKSWWVWKNYKNANLLLNIVCSLATE